MDRIWAPIRGWIVSHKIAGTAVLGVALLAFQLAWVLPDAPIGNRLRLLVPISVVQAIFFMFVLRYPQQFPGIAFWRKRRDPDSN